MNCNYIALAVSFTFLSSHFILIKKYISSLGGFEPPTFRLTAERANQLRHRDLDGVSQPYMANDPIHAGRPAGRPASLVWVGSVDDVAKNRKDIK